ncbi:MAG: hypothetical protein RIB03_10370 [Henriciella sp.]|uniref:hypothetical protein n=1 Tax=Henriciella sp. TaxID=1968823 RepID=UPI0032EC2FAF
MRLSLTVAIAAAAIIAPTALAQGNDTLRAVVANGVVINVGKHAIPISYKEDGTYSGAASGASFAGKWRIDGAKLCTISEMSPSETCTTYPDGMGPGDEFEVTNPSLGKVTVRIRKQG